VISRVQPTALIPLIEAVAKATRLYSGRPYPAYTEPASGFRHAVTILRPTKETNKKARGACRAPAVYLQAQA